MNNKTKTQKTQHKNRHKKNTNHIKTHKILNKTKEQKKDKQNIVKFVNKTA